ncbi:MAG: S41 family peptidase [Clostridia bacterium]|nr:S41 family peptidase [Clostridia bacterium]
MYSKKHIVISVIVTFAVTALAVSGIYTVMDAGKPKDVLLEAKEIIVDNYVDTLTQEQLDDMNDAAIAAMVASLNDPYSYYFDMEAFDQYEENNKEEYVGIGVNVSYNAEAGTLTVTSPTAGAPAEKAGILPLDLIVGVDDLTLEKDGYDAIIDHIKGGKAGDTVKIHILRNEKALTFDVERAVITLDTISGKMLDGDIAYIRISEFQHNSVEDFKAALDDIKQKGAKGLIIDLRSNPGGYADSVIQMTDMLLPKGTIAYLEDNKGNKEYFESDAKCINLPMVVLVNEGTASAAELMSGSLQAYDLATIVGKKTYGKAVGQSPYMLTEETAIYLTSARYFTPKGNCIDKKGIVPDVEVDLTQEQKARLSTLPEEEDTQLQAGITALKERIQ